MFITHKKRIIIKASAANISEESRKIALSITCRIGPRRRPRKVPGLLFSP
jgi:hypothetical protein